MSVVAEARTHARPFKTEASEDELAGLRERREKLLGVERQAKEAIDVRVAELEVAFARRDVAAVCGLPRLDLAPLRWRAAADKRLKWLSVPKLALVGLDDPTFALHASFGSGAGKVAPVLPGGLVGCYADVLTQLRQFRCLRAGQSATLSYTFAGVIPDTTRGLIAEHLEAASFERILLIAEAPLDAWAYDEEFVPPQRLDPLVVGWAADALWLIDRFDPTPIEEYVAGEFAR